MKRPTFQEVPGLWEVDGSLRDLYVLNTSASDWETLLEFVAQFPCAYTYDGETRTRPSVEQLLNHRDGSHLLRITLGSATVNCHFFAETEIELDLEPREIEASNEHDQVLRFMEGLASAVAKPVLLTPENSSDAPYISYEPASSAWHIYA
jgi:hypothetical protein